MATSFLLASRSPRRIELLAAAGFRFDIVAPNIAERDDVDFTMRELTAWNALRKGISIARAHPDKIVLAADTLVALHDRIIGKPADLDEARKILRRLSGRTHQVCSAVFICHRAAGRSTSFHEISQVRFRRLTDAMIDNYFAKINPLDKAGAYAAQSAIGRTRRGEGSGAEIIEKIDGSFTNVVGLPMEKTALALAQFGVHPSR